MHRRSFLGAAASAAGALSLPLSASNTSRSGQLGSHQKGFQLKYAPHFGMFGAHAGDDLVAQLEFMHAEGFRALEDNGAPRRSIEDQEKIGATLERLGMEMGVFVAHADFGKVTCASDDDDTRKAFLDQIRNAVEVAKRVNARWCTVVPGCYAKNLEWDYQTANVVDNLRRAAEICEPAGLTMVLEPLNPWRDHPGLFLTKIPQAFMICRAVNSPSCKILNDLYHQQITEGNLIPNLDLAWSETVYLQVGDNPGRKEPTTGEINYRNVFKHLHGRGFEGIVGMEHGKSKGGKAGERAVIDAYRYCDSF